MGLSVSSRTINENGASGGLQARNGRRVVGTLGSPDGRAPLIRRLAKDFVHHFSIAITVAAALRSRWHLRPMWENS